MWTKDSTGKFVWTADGIGNPNKPGDNITPTDPFAGIAGLLTTGNSKPGSQDITGIKYDVSGLGLPASVTGGKTVLDADTFINALHKTALTNSGVWAGIQYAMYRAHYYGQSMPDLGVWDQSSDVNTLKKFMSDLTIINTDKTQPAAVNTFLTDQENAAIKLGGAGVRIQIAKVTIPNELDLNYIGDKAFRTALGMAPTPKQLKAFVKSYQGDVMAVARTNAANATASNQAMSNINSQTNMTPGVTSNNTIAQNYTSASQSPATQILAQPDVANADVAAADFARKSNPAQAGSENISNALNAMFTSLARKSQ
jgi:hypothetical protein